VTSTSGDPQTGEKLWQPIGRNQRRVLGVLIEKAKTTPDNYPMSVAALVAGCKQKSNRDPLMDLDEEEVLETLDQLRALQAVREVQGSGRVNKYRHAAYEWLGVNAPQSAVMTELLLRGPQTLGELRARASRMEPFESLDAVQTVVNELVELGLVEPLTPPGRGQTFGHTLYEPHERQKVLGKAGVGAAAAGSDLDTEQIPKKSAAQLPDSPVADESVAELVRMVGDLRARVERLESELGLG
jgi:uncharacterized protein YceH (UPF0502 family)